MTPISRLITTGLMVVSAILSQSNVSGLDGSGLILEGNYEYFVFQGSEQSQYSERFPFSVSIKDCSWIISFEDRSALTNADVLDARTTASCDGTNIHVITFQNQDAVKKAWGSRYESTKSRLPVAMAKIFPGDYPPPKEPTLQHIWLAFASHCVLKDSSGKAKPPFIVDMAIFSDANYNCDYKWTSDNSNSNLRKLVLTEGGTAIGRQPKTGKLLRVELPSPYDKGYLSAEARWLQATNMAGISVPLDFEFTAWTPKFHGANASSDLSKSFTYRCLVTNVYSAEIPQIPGQLPKGKVLVSDRRFEHRGYAYVNYEISDSKWRGPSDAFLAQIPETTPRISLEDEALAELGIKPLGAQSAKIQSTPSRVSITRFTILILLAALPVGLLIAKIFRKNQDQPN